MSAGDLDAALAAPDNVVGCRQFYQLTLPDQQFNKSTLSTTASAYLVEFCNSTLSVTRRRWVGLVLRRIIGQSARSLADDELAHIGQVILSSTEGEETRIVAGLIIREGLSQGISYASFWPSAMVPDSVPFFPNHDGSEWMKKFQDFLDAFVDLKISGPSTDPAILYLVSFTASDGYKWREADTAVPIVLVQNDTLTIIASDVDMRIFDFVDIPLDHIRGTRLQKATLHDSQARKITHEPWSLVLSLKPGAWTFLLNDQPRTGDEFTVLLAHSQDATELNNCLHETSSSISVARPRMANSQKPPAASHLDESVNINQSRRTTSSQSKALPVGLGNQHDSPPPPYSIGADEPPTDDGVEIGSHVKDIEVAPIPNASDTLSSVRKKKDVPSRTGTAKMDGGGDEFGFPDETPRIKRNNKKSSGGAKSAGTGVIHHSASNSVPKNRSDESRSQTKPPTQTKLKPKLKPKPKPKSSSSHNQQVSGDSGDEDGLFRTKVAQAPVSASSGKVKAIHAIRSSLTTTSSGEPQQVARSARLPKVFKPATKKLSSPKNAADDVFTVPQDEEPQLQARDPRNMTKIKPVYLEIGSSESEPPEPESSESDFGETHKNKSRKQSLLKENYNKKNTRDVRSMQRPEKPKKPSTTCEPAISPTKHTVVAALVRSKPEPTPKSSASLSKPMPMAAPKSRVPAKQHTNVSILDKDGSPPPRIQSPVPPSEAHILAKLNGHDEDIPSLNADDSKTEKSDRTRSVSPSLDATNVDKTPFAPGPDQHQEEAFKTAPQLKRSLDSDTPSTPRAKRQKMVPLDSASIVRNSISNLPATFAPPKALTEPSSPCVELKRSRQQLKQAHKDHNAPITHASVADNMHIAIISQDNAVMRPHPGNQLQRRRTPLNQSVQRTLSTESENAEILSSNSKPLPAAPGTSSRAISGHADQAQMTLESEAGASKMSRYDPFKTQNPQLTKFTRRLTDENAGSIQPENELHSSSDELDVSKLKQLRSNILHVSDHTRSAHSKPVTQSLRQSMPPRKGVDQAKFDTVQCFKALDQAPSFKRQSQQDIVIDDAIQTPPVHVVEPIQPQEACYYDQDGVDMEGDTLVAQEDISTAFLKATPIVFGSSPPVRRQSSSGHSSTSAEPEERTETQSSTVPLDKAEEMEWTTSLQPHQRPIAEQLTRISKRIMCHIVDKETAVHYIADTYANDGEHLLTKFAEQHEDRFDTISKRVENNKAVMKRDAERLAKKLAKERQRLRPGAGESRPTGRHYLRSEDKAATQT